MAITASMPASRRIARIMARSACIRRPSIRGLLTRCDFCRHVRIVSLSRRSVRCSRGALSNSLGLTDWFRGVYGTEPDGRLDDKRDLVAAVLRTEALAAGDTVMVGDRSHDMIGAHANGLRAVGVLWGYGSRSELEAAGADALVNTAGDLPGALVGAAGVGGCGR